MRKIMRREVLYPLGMVVGALGAYWYYLEVGCYNGACPLTTSPVGSVFTGALIGGLLMGFFDKKKRE